MYWLNQAGIIMGDEYANLGLRLQTELLHLPVSWRRILNVSDLAAHEGYDSEREAKRELESAQMPPPSGGVSISSTVRSACPPARSLRRRCARSPAN